MKYFLLIIFLHFSSPSGAAIDSYSFTDPKQQADYASLTAELRCLVCQNQTIGDSNAELAADLRRQVYEMLQQGKSKDDVLQFMTDRYGDFVLYKPPFKATTSLLWLGPAAFLLIGLTVLFFVSKRKKSSATTPINDPEKLATARQLLADVDKENTV
jgi:cytochrome c-type biogenesis protein CcmH